MRAKKEKDSSSVYCFSWTHLCLACGVSFGSRQYSLGSPKEQENSKYALRECIHLSPSFPPQAAVWAYGGNGGLCACGARHTPHVIVFCSSTVTVFFFSASLLFFTSSFLSISPSLSLSLLPQHRHFYPRHFTRLIHMRINIDSRLEQGVENTVSFHIFFFLRIKKKEKKEERCQVSFFLPFFLLGSTQERTPPLWTGELFTFQQIKPTYFHCITSLFSPFLHDFLFCSCWILRVRYAASRLLWSSGASKLLSIRALAHHTYYYHYCYHFEFTIFFSRL